MATDYAEVPLSVPLDTLKGKAETIIVIRPTAGAMIKVLDAPNTHTRISTFVESCCLARVNGGDERVKFNADELNVIDSGDLASIVTAMGEDAAIELPAQAGDGITSSIIYDLQHPITLGKRGSDGSSGSDVIEQIEFRARTLGEISSYLDSSGTGNEFRAFMKTFGTLLGTKLPMSDGILDAMDFLDFLIIRSQIMGKLVRARNRWKKL